MARLTKHERGLTVETFYGINSKTFEVECVHLTKDGVLQKYNEDMGRLEHPVLFGRSPRTEIVVVWGLSDVISVPMAKGSESRVKEEIENLRVKAAEKKGEATKT